ncbi:hypothetical protein AWM79_19230 [Pseudomonas agarici]|uniref:Uncharacterized protein n=1 Tax=Pseudomonas agarici TaxID=46677 RepID=A0A0X1T5H7_PSEAA|nr:hypothetical protein [Pseudomonas agarici]AMB87310.1 hypothetical protein AWM79_19230 [Pseudomonas agarici]NWB93541.1 hypothetical protein [Pseudomonas agarici]NWC11199.1 hypothetical protein [Pseudomonas agarici]SEL00788.1 hypothetical protein SAMN05216604_109143 [Pseudomonas agarici]
MPNSETTKKPVYLVAISASLALSLAYIGWLCIFPRNMPHLTEVILRTPLAPDAFIYGIKDERGGATVPFSYRYYVYRTLPADSDILSELKTATPFLVTRDESITLDIRDSTITVAVDKEVYDYHSNTLYRHANGVDYTPVNIYLRTTPGH